MLRCSRRTKAPSHRLRRSDARVRCRDSAHHPGTRAVLRSDKLRPDPVLGRCRGRVVSGPRQFRRHSLLGRFSVDGPGYPDATPLGFAWRFHTNDATSSSSDADGDEEIVEISHQEHARSPAFVSIKVVAVLGFHSSHCALLPGKGVADVGTCRRRCVARYRALRRIAPRPGRASRRRFLRASDRVGESVEAGYTSRRRRS